MEEKKPRFCHLCGEKLHGTYLIYDNHLVVCGRCNTTIPHCSQCNIPSRQLTSARGVLICPACRKKAPVCPCCHEPILKGEHYFKIGESPAPYCESCVNTRHRCDICRVPLDDQGKVFPGRDVDTYRCASCLRSAVARTEEAERLYRETSALLQRELQLAIPVLPKLRIVERAVLGNLNHQTSTLESTDTPLGPEHQHLLGFFQRVNEDRTIFIERLLPQALFQAVAAHELAHAWQSFYAPSTQSAKIVEGFAEWVAYRVLLALGQQRDAARLTRRSDNDIYGAGLQYFIALERQSGRAGAIQRARQA
jgi:hypothetical protein